MKIRPLLVILLTQFCLISCDYYDNRLKIINKSRDILIAEVFPDTIPTFPSPNRTEFYLRVTIQPDSTYIPTMPEANGWEREIFRSKNNRLNLFVFGLDSLQKYESIDTLISRKIYRRVSRSKEELTKDKWIITIQ